MARSRTLLQLRTAVRATADMVNGTFVTDSQILWWVNQSLNDLWEIITTAEPDRYVTESTINAVAGTKAYALPADFYKLRYVDLVSGSERITCHEFMTTEKNQYQYPLGLPRPPRYNLIGANITFEPDPGTATYKLGYIALFTEMTVDGSTFDGIAGYEDFVVYDVAARCCDKEEATEQAAMFRAERGRIEQRIRQNAQDRDFSRAPTIGRVRYGRRHQHPLYI